MLDRLAITTELSRTFGVSAMTIRRDLAALEREGLVRRTHGGAVLVAERDRHTGYRLRERIRVDVKDAIAREAAKLVRPGDCIFIDAGTTTGAVTRYIRTIRPLRVVTHAVNVSANLGDLLDIAVTQIGGDLYRASFAAVGAQAVEAIRQYHVDKLFLGVCGLDRAAGLTNTNREEAEVKRTAIETASEVIVLADSSKFGRVAFAPIAPLQVVHRVVTDEGVKPEWVEMLRGEGIDVIVARTGKGVWAPDVSGRQSDRRRLTQDGKTD